MQHKKNLVIQITNDSYGSGSGSLGETLMKSYMYALTEIEPYPETILFINTGARLTAANSPVLDSLRQLETAGVKILTCGTCINFLKLNETPEVGKVTNMYDIVEKMNSAVNTIVI